MCLYVIKDTILFQKKKKKSFIAFFIFILLTIFEQTGLKIQIKINLWPLVWYVKADTHITPVWPLSCRRTDLTHATVCQHNRSDTRLDFFYCSRFKNKRINEKCCDGTSPIKGLIRVVQTNLTPMTLVLRKRGLSGGGTLAHTHPHRQTHAHSHITNYQTTCSSWCCCPCHWMPAVSSCTVTPGFQNDLHSGFWRAFLLLLPKNNEIKTVGELRW